MILLTFYILNYGHLALFDNLYMNFIFFLGKCQVLKNSNAWWKIANWYGLFGLAG